MLYQPSTDGLESGTVRSFGNYFEVTKKGSEEFALLSTLRIGVFVSVVMGVLLLYYYVALRIGITVQYEWVRLVSVVMFRDSGVYAFTFKVFAPIIPEEAKKLL